MLKDLSIQAGCNCTYRSAPTQIHFLNPSHVELGWFQTRLELQACSSAEAGVSVLPVHIERTLGRPWLVALDTSHGMGIGIHAQLPKMFVCRTNSHLLGGVPQLAPLLSCTYCLTQALRVDLPSLAISCSHGPFVCSPCGRSFTAAQPAWLHSSLGHEHVRGHAHT